MLGGYQDGDIDDGNVYGDGDDDGNVYDDGGDDGNVFDNGDDDNGGDIIGLRFLFAFVVLFCSFACLLQLQYFTKTLCASKVEREPRRMEDPHRGDKKRSSRSCAVRRPYKLESIVK
ncbi:hypothetical protein ElyMa_005380900 [Elysia marginata]|uniref:Uncharacterized protein n=1 Tax=Elysia marginata TaxID=1093978 RepID=A0AAV4EF02_9GAST|nr:hypothetical protein ElyMa_005380900 [Elysia marginata]